MKLPRHSSLGFWLLFESEEGRHTLAPIDLVGSDSREIEMIGISDGSTIVCFPHHT